MKNRALIIIIFIVVFALAFTNSLNGQRWKLRRYEFGGGIGTSQIFGDIGGTSAESNWLGVRDVLIQETRPSFNFHARYKINSAFSAKIAFVLGNGHGDYVTSGLLRQRSYKSTFGELSGQIEYYLFQELRSRSSRSYAGYHRLGMLNNYNVFATYLFIGGGVTYSYSTHEYQEVWIERDDYRSGGNIIPVIPFGIGVKYIIDDHWVVAAELGYRYAFSDYVDGYKQTLNSESNDVYYVFNLSVIYRLRTTRRNLPAILDRRYQKMVR